MAIFSPFSQLSGKPLKNLKNNSLKVQTNTISYIYFYGDHRGNSSGRIVCKKKKNTLHSEPLHSFIYS
jgi:hypothetical protein